MKKLLLLVISIIYGFPSTSFSQEIPNSHGENCLNCVPAGYSILEGQPGIGDPFESTGDMNDKWLDPHFFTMLDPGHGYMTLLHQVSGSDVVSFTSSGFTPGRYYLMTFSVKTNTTTNHPIRPDFAHISVHSGGTGHLKKNLFPQQIIHMMV